MAVMLLMLSFNLEMLQQTHNSHKDSLQIEMEDHFDFFLCFSPSSWQKLMQKD